MEYISFLFFFKTYYEILITGEGPANSFKFLPLLDGGDALENLLILHPLPGK